MLPPSTKPPTITPLDLVGLLMELAPLALLQPAGEGVIPWVICLAGPTGTGKTATSLELAHYLPIEIISADSVQVYRGMDIGTAKASVEERLKVPHYMLDISPVSTPFTASDFFERAEQLIGAIHARGKIPVVVGGTGFYFDTLLYGLPHSPPPDEEVRKELETLLEIEGVDYLYNQLQTIDPDYAATLTLHDKQKIVRGLEIYRVTGKKVSDQPWDKSQPRSKYRFLCYFLHRPKELLYQRVELRCDQMLANGLIQEVIDLEEYGLRNNRSAMQAIGYRQVLNFLKTEQTPDDYDKLRYDLKLASRHYIKRQFTWFRRHPLFKWVNLEEVTLENFFREILQKLTGKEK